MTKRAKIKLATLAVALACSSGAWAGLGKINVHSNLGEVLRADIELTGIRSADLEGARVGLAGTETFQDLNVDYAGILSTLRFSLTPSSRGALVKVSSASPINEPYLHFILEAKTVSGRSVREYTVLLDPANYGAGANGQNIVQDVPAYADNNLSNRYRAQPAPVVRAVPEALKVRPGNTLRGLAARVRPKGATLGQTMAALMDANPQAFPDGSPSSLKVGSTLKVPSRAKIKAVGADKAAAMQGQPAKPETPPEQGKDVLKLMPAAPAGDNGELQQQLSQREQALKNMESRVAMLEAQLQALQSGKPASVASAPVATLAPIAAASAPAAMAPAVASQPAAAAKPEAKKPVKHMAPPPPPPEPSMLDRILDNLPLVGGGVAGVGLLGALGVLIARRRKGAAQDAKGADSSISALARAAVSTAPTVSGGGHSFMSNFTQAAGAIDAGEVDPVAEAEVYIAYGRDVQAEEILKDALNKDPSRHEVRMKLMEVYAARPDAAAFEKLAREMHAAYDGKGAMWAKAAGMGRALDPNNPLYQSVEEDVAAEPVATGNEPIDLDQELFGGDLGASPAAPETVPEQAGSVEDDPLAALLAEHAEPAAPAAAPEPADHGLLDFDMDAALSAPAAPAPAHEEKPAAAETNLLDFDFNLDSLSVAETPAAPHAPAEEHVSETAHANQGFESLYEDMLASPATPAAHAEPSLAAEGLSVLDDPLSTKLDLAKVYLDMGDRDGAKEVLQDLLTEAQGPLKNEAQALLAKISS